MLSSFVENVKRSSVGSSRRQVACVSKLLSESTMKACAFVFLFVFCYAECRKTYAPIDKNANLAFINMEAGGVRAATPPGKASPGQPAVAPAAVTPAAVKPGASPTKPAPPSPIPAQKPITAPVYPSPTPVTPSPTPVKPVVQPAQIQPKPVYPAPVANPITTPGPGSVKQLINFYDSQGKASPIRPYSYSQAVKQG